MTDVSSGTTPKISRRQQFLFDEAISELKAGHRPVFTTIAKHPVGQMRFNDWQHPLWPDYATDPKRCADAIAEFLSTTEADFQIVARVTGGATGEMAIDFDNHGAWLRFQEIVPPQLLAKMVQIKSPLKEFPHLHFRCKTTVTREMQGGHLDALAKIDGKSAIELKYDGRLITVARWDADTQANRMQVVCGDRFVTPEITEAELRELLAAAVSLDERPTDAKDQPAPGRWDCSIEHESEDAAWIAYIAAATNERYAGKLHEILEDHGYDATETQYWRPGNSRGVNAATGQIHERVVSCFSPNDPLYETGMDAQQGKIHTAFSLLAHFNHDGDELLAAADLAQKLGKMDLEQWIHKDDCPFEPVTTVVPPPQDVHATLPPPAPPRTTHRKAIRDCDIKNLPNPKPLAKGWLFAGTQVVMFGDTNVGKSFVALDLANSVARGVPFVGKFEVPKAAPVAYIYSEGQHGLKKRCQAWKQNRQQQDSENIVYLPYQYVINDGTGESIAEIVTEATEALGRMPTVLVIDTLAKNMAGNESDTGEMSAMVNAAADLVTRLGITIVWIHHCGKDPSKGARGSYALKCGADTEILIEEYKAQFDTIEMSHTKSRDDKKARPAIIKKKIIHMGFDDDGDEITSLAVDYSHSTEEFEGTTQAKAVQDDLPARIINVLTTEPTTAKAIAQEIGVAKRTLYRTLKELRDANKIGWKELHDEKTNTKTQRYWKV